MIFIDNVYYLQVDVKKLKYFYMEDDGGSVLISNVDPELKAAQNKVRFLIKGIWKSACELLINIQVTLGQVETNLVSIIIWVCIGWLRQPTFCEWVIVV